MNPLWFYITMPVSSSPTPSSPSCARHLETHVAVARQPGCQVARLPGSTNKRTLPSWPYQHIEPLGPKPFLIKKVGQDPPYPPFTTGRVQIFGTSRPLALRLAAALKGQRLSAGRTSQGPVEDHGGVILNTFHKQCKVLILQYLYPYKCYHF